MMGRNTAGVSLKAAGIASNNAIDAAKSNVEQHPLKSPRTRSAVREEKKTSEYVRVPRGALVIAHRKRQVQQQASTIKSIKITAKYIIMYLKRRKDEIASMIAN